MKKIYLFLFLAISFCNTNAQNMSAICGDDVVWYGLDFSNAKFVGQFTNVGDNVNSSGFELRDKHIPAWNMLILNEPNKYNIRKSFRKSNVFNQLETVNERNSKIDVEKMLSYNTYKFEKDKETVNKVISEYTGGEKKEGLGLVFIVESFDKMANTATVYVTFFDIATKKVLLTEKFVETPMGVGVRNYWAGALAKIFKTVDTQKISEWKSKCK
jgi:hypothetical protein